VQPTSGILRDLQAFSWLRVYTALKPSPGPAHLRVTPTVSPPVVTSLSGLVLNICIGETQ